MTLAISKELKQDMDRFPEMNWSQVAREAITSRIKLMEEFRKFTEKSTFSEQDALKLGKELTKCAARKHKARH